MLCVQDDIPVLSSEVILSPAEAFARSLEGGTLQPPEGASAGKRSFEDTLTVDAAGETFEAGKRVKVMASDDDCDAGQLLLGFFNTVHNHTTGPATISGFPGSFNGPDDTDGDENETVARHHLGKHVLIADDSLSTRNYLKKHLERNGYSVDTVENGHAALELMKAKVSPPPPLK